MRLLVGGLHEFDGGDDHHEAELVAEGRQSVVDGGSGLDADDGLKRGADLAFAAELFDLLLKVGAYRADGVPLGEEGLGAGHFGQRFEAFREDRFAFVGREDLEGLLGREGEDRSHQAQERLRDVPEGRLSGAAGAVV